MVTGPTPPTTLSDVAAFQPQGGALVVEPGWWSLPRVPTNMYSLAGVETQAGELLGWPIEVRFTPRSYLWSSGDGQATRTGHPGGSWGGAQFSQTSTAHTYAAPGLYSISLQVDYAVSYRFPGEAFVDLPGLVTRTLGTRTVHVLRVSPVLTEAGCQPAALVGGRCP